MPPGKYSLQILKEIGKISGDGLLIYDVRAASVYCCNKAFARILELPPGDIMDRGLESIRPALKDDDHFLKRAYEQFKAAFTLLNLELRIVSENEKYVSVDAYLLEKRGIVVVFVKDITKSKAHLNYIVEFGARKNTILDAISHNLSGPLNVMNNLVDELDRVSKVQHYKRIDQPARLIRENTQQCIDLISSFLKEEHLASPGIPVGAKRFDAMAKIKIVVNRYSEYNLTRQIRVIGPEKLFSTGDDVKFFQVVNNLVSNAIKFTHDDGQVIVEASEKDATMVVSVKDNGIGIPEYMLPHLFRKNTPAARPGLRGEKSLGLGLYVIKKLVDVMEGSIAVESEEGKGATFTVVLPRAMH